MRNDAVEARRSRNIEGLVYNAKQLHFYTEGHRETLKRFKHLIM